MGESVGSGMWMILRIFVGGCVFAFPCGRTTLGSVVGGNRCLVVVLCGSATTLTLGTRLLFPDWFLGCSGNTRRRCGTVVSHGICWGNWGGSGRMSPLLFWFGGIMSPLLLWCDGIIQASGFAKRTLGTLVLLRRSLVSTFGLDGS